MKIDINSPQFKEELKNTVRYTDNVCKVNNFVYNENNEINENIKIGLTRNKIVYGEYFCPCFMVMGETKEEQVKDSENRMCPCTPALTNEIPNEGSCHCKIFNDPTFVKNKEESINSSVPKELEGILSRPEISSHELRRLLDARNEGKLNFKLVDVRELLEERNGKIPDTDVILPTSMFFKDVDSIKDFKDIPTVVYCHAGSRSAQVCQILKDRFDFKNAINLAGGIMGCGYLE
ncbi:MAG: Rhodanese domain protein [uncultured Campylobacterales bacterium]|uniref:Rhodanese domain protein n=1 Tax=uncultured Campylobacterales bacterium TaxID=352960 RepID=A0A6S6SWN3_9BACT|nr:MAG: Rhodanese domain protein [uncultured Campylobacterales bacterium]